MVWAVLAGIRFKLTTWLADIVLADWQKSQSLSQGNQASFVKHFLFFGEWICSWFDLKTVSDLVSLLRDSGAVIIGSLALMLMCPTDFLPNDLNFALPANATASLLQFFLQSRSYISMVKSKTRSIPSRPSMLHHVEVLEHRTLKRRIHLSFYTTISIPAIVLDSSSTLLANCITADAYLCLFPATTLQRKGIRLQKGTTPEANFSKYVNRGFTLLPQINSNVLDTIYDLKNSLVEPVLWVSLSDRNVPLLEPVEWVLPFRPTNGSVRRHKLGFASTTVDDFGA